MFSMRYHIVERWRRWHHIGCICAECEKCGAFLLLPLSSLVVLEPVKDILALDSPISAELGCDSLYLMCTRSTHTASIQCFKYSYLLRWRIPSRPSWLCLNLQNILHGTSSSIISLLLYNIYIYTGWYQLSEQVVYFFLRKGIKPILLIWKH